jgi:hypothetical protein
MMDHFHHSSQVTLFLEITGINANERKKLIGIYEVEVAGKGQVPGGNGISFDKGVTEVRAILALCTVAQVAQKHFSQEGDMAFHETGVFFDIGLVLFQLLYFPHYFRKDVCDRLVITTSDPVEERVSGFSVKLDSGYSRSILAPVVLFFHQEVQLVKAVQNSAVLLQVIGERLS